MADSILTWENLLPERKLELHQGQLIAGSLEGSKRLLWMLLQEYGPSPTLSLTSANLLTQALRHAYDTSDYESDDPAWWHWATQYSYQPTLPPLKSSESRNGWFLSKLRQGLWMLTDQTSCGTVLGPDFAVKLNEDIFTPQAVLFKPDTQATLYDSHAEGAPDLLIEVIPAGYEESYDQKLRQYQKHSVSEIWFITPNRPEITFYQQTASGYDQRTVSAEAIQKIVKSQQDQTYQSPLFPSWRLSLLDLFSPLFSERVVKEDRSLHSPFILEETGTQSTPTFHKSGKGWGTLPFRPVLDIYPTPISFTQFISWCGEAKFEYDSGKTIIGGPVATQQVLGMLLMTFGLAESVGMLPLREWVVHLQPWRFQEELGHRVQYWMNQAEIEEKKMNVMHHQQNNPPTHSVEISYYGTLPGVTSIRTYERTTEECRDRLHYEIYQWELLKISRGIPRETTDWSPYPLVR